MSKIEKFALYFAGGLNQRGESLTRLRGRAKMSTLRNKLKESRMNQPTLILCAPTR
jgi:hypothetical protein